MLTADSVVLAIEFGWLSAAPLLHASMAAGCCQQACWALSNSFGGCSSLSFLFAADSLHIAAAVRSAWWFLLHSQGTVEATLDEEVAAEKWAGKKEEPEYVI